MARALPQSFTLVLEPVKSFFILYLLLIISIIMFQGSIFYITWGCYSSCSEDEPQIWRFPVIRKSREASVRFLRPNPSPLARPWPSTLAISRMRTCLQTLLLPQGTVDDKGFVFSVLGWRATRQWQSKGDEKSRIGKETSVWAWRVDWGYGFGM